MNRKFRLTLVDFFPQNFDQLIGRFFGKNLLELGTVVFHHADPFDDDIVDFQRAAFIGEPVKKRDLLAVLGLELTLYFSPTFFKHFFLVKDNYLIGVSQQSI